MRIFYVHERFGALAGAEANAQITAEELGARGHQVGLLHGLGTGKEEDEWRRTFPTRFALSGKNQRAEVERGLKEFRPDLVYVHKMSDLSVLRALVDSGLPLVRMVHDHDIYCMRSYKYNYLTRKICKRAASAYCVFPCLAGVVRNPAGRWPLKFVSYASKQQEIRLNRKFHRMVVVTNYMREELLRNRFEAGRIEIHAPVPRMGISGLRSTFGPRNRIVYAGQIIRGKGVDVLLRGLSRVEVPFECCILGEGSHRRYCEGLSRKLGLSDRVQFKGFVPQSALIEFYREACLCAVSSVWPEPIATIGLEVMRYALPVVAFDAGGIRDWLLDGYNGFLVPWMDHDAYGQRVQQLLEDKALARRMGENGLRLVSERYDFSKYIVDLEVMFDQVVREQRRPMRP